MKFRLGALIEQVSIRCGIKNHKNISGINIQKRFMHSNNSASDTSKYKIVEHNQFACNLMHVGRDGKIPIAINADNEEIVVSPAYNVFEVINNQVVDVHYLNMVFTSTEFDRYAWFCTDASIRGNLDWERFLDIEIDLPPLHIQEKYVAVYQAMLANQKAYENGLEDLKLVCDATIERLRREMPSESIGQYIEQIDERNSEGKVKLAQGVSVDLEFIDAKRVANNYKSCKIVHDGEFAYNKVMKANGTKFPIALRKGETCFISGSYQVFKVIDQNQLISEYLMMWLSRPEIQRYAGYISWGSTRDVLQWDVLGEIEIPIPDLHIQQSIVDIYNAYITRKKINERLKQQIKDICPILIAGAIKEANAIA